MRFSATWWFFASKGSKNVSERDVVVIRNSKIEHVLLYKSLTNQDIALRFGQLVLWTISIRCGLLQHDGFLPLRGRKMRRKVTSLSSETQKLNTFCLINRQPIKILLWDLDRLYPGQFQFNAAYCYMMVFCLEGVEKCVEKWYRPILEIICLQ